MIKISFSVSHSRKLRSVGAKYQRGACQRCQRGWVQHPPQRDRRVTVHRPAHAQRPEDGAVQAVAHPRRETW